MFIPQSIQTQVELEEIACVERQIISPSTSKTANGTKQDGVIGGYNLTHPTLKIDWKTAMNLITYTSIEDFSQIPKGQDLTGAKLYSMIIPPKVSIKNKSVTVKNGEIVDGRINGDSLGAKEKSSLTLFIWDEYGVDRTENFCDDTRWLNNNFNLWHGFSVGYGDLESKHEIKVQIDNMFETKRLEVQHLITEIENNPDLMSKDLMELKIYNLLKGTNEEGNKLISGNLSEKNAFKIMMASGAKGKADNVGQMMGCLGLQAFEGKIMPKKYNHRSMPYFHQNDDTSESRGLVRSCFHSGLDFVEFFYQTVNGRSGLIDQAVKSVTRETEIIVLENEKINYVCIGDWIDKKMDENKEKIEHHNTANMELLNLTEKVYIPTCDDNGKTSWGEMTAITRHDPGNNLYEIKTQGGRSVIVAESKSLIIWNEATKKFEMKHTPDVVIGDSVPTTMNLAEPPVIKKYVDMTDYFPKTEYIYGTDFWKAKKSVEKAMEGRERIPAGWWENNNNKEFILPYTKKASVTRALIRSNVENIKEGCIYPYGASREPILLPEKFELNRENGVFIGLYLADGNTDGKYIQITKKEKNVKEFVKKWFDKYNISNKENSRKTERGEIEDIRGYSALLSRFLDKFVGHGAENKFVPNEAFTAPDEFIIGLLDGYFSGDGYVRASDLGVSSVSSRLVIGISHLCNRLGIFGKISKSQQEHNNLGTENIKPIYTFNIRSKWANIFSQKISLTNKDKDDKLKIISCTKEHINFDSHNDVVLDKIVEINKLSVENHPKLYDVTVPSTINFTVANGLNVRDTATTGYMQNKLVKSFEDIMIKYDGTVRNANNYVLQYIYGDSGADTITQYEYTIQFMNMDNEELEKNYIFSKEELADVKFSEKENKELFEKYKQMRNHIMKCVRKAKLNYIAKLDNYMIPVNLTRIIATNKEKSDKKDLTPKYILEKIEELLTNEKTPIVCMNNKEKANPKSFKYQDEQYHKTIFKTAVYDILCPKKVLLDYGWDKEKFESVIENISSTFEKNIVEPGEMVGVIAACATGEPLTQMNLSSFHQAGVSRTNANNMGVPRMSEIFSVSKNPKAPEMKIYLNPEIRDKKEIYHKIKSNLKHTVFSEVRKKITVFYDPNPSFKEGLTKEDNIIPFAFTKNASKTSCQSDISNLPYLIRVEIDREKMAEKEIKLVDITSQFCNWWELRYTEGKNVKKEEKRVMNKITQLSILSNSDNEIEQIIHIRFNARDYEKDKFDLNTINDFIEHVLDKFKLKGINDITDIPTFPEDKIVVFDEETGKSKQEKEFVIVTSGVNLTAVRYINGIDLNRTLANDIVGMYETFGIEIARSLLLTEISEAYSAAGGAVNPQHIEIIVDQMTMSGSINSIDRHGISKSDVDPLSRASFEKPVEQLWKSALFGESDHMNGVSSRIMAGLCIKGGTGYCDLVLNTEMIENADYEESELDKKYEEIKTENITADIVKKAHEDENVFMPM